MSSWQRFALVVGACLLLAGCWRTPNHQVLPKPVPSSVAPAPGASRGQLPTRLTCPASAVHPQPVLSAKVGTLAPTKPVAGRLCHYAGMNATPRAGALVRDIAVADPAGLAALINQAEAIPTGVMYSCPIWDGGLLEIMFADDSGRTTVVEVALGGCSFVRSTRTTGSYRLSPAAWVALQHIDPTIFPGRRF